MLFSLHREKKFNKNSYLKYEETKRILYNQVLTCSWPRRLWVRQWDDRCVPSPFWWAFRLRLATARRFVWAWQRPACCSIARYSNKMCSTPACARVLASSPRSFVSSAFRCESSSSSAPRLLCLSVPNTVVAVVVVVVVVVVVDVCMFLRLSLEWKWFRTKLALNNSNNNNNNKTVY